MKTTSIICKGQVRTVEDAVDSWKLEHHEATRVRTLEDVISLCTFIHSLFDNWEKELWECAFSSSLVGPYAEGEALKNLLDRALNVLPGVERMIRWAESRGYVIDGSKKYEDAMNKIGKLQEDFGARWPFFVDEKQLEAARTEIARGEGRTAKEVFNDLQCSNSA